MIPLLASLFLAQKGSPDVTRVSLPQNIYSISPVGPSDSHLVVVQAFEYTANATKKPGTVYFLVDALSRKVTPLPFASALGENNGGDTLDMIMSPREVWRVPFADPSTKTVFRTNHEIGSICFYGDSAEGYYVTPPSQNAPSKLFHLIGTRGERAIPLTSGMPLRPLYCLAGRCLVQFDDGTVEGSQRFHLAWVSAVTGKIVGMASKIDYVEVAGGRPNPYVFSNGLVLEFAVPAVEHNSIGGPKLQVYKVLNLAGRKVVGQVKIPYPDGQDAGMGISCSNASTACLFCVATQEVNPIVDKKGLTRVNSRFRRRYYLYRVGASQVTNLFGNSVPDLTAISGNDWSMVCAVTNDGNFLVATGRNDGEFEIVPILNKVR
jgi:hypothetical protein